MSEICLEINHLDPEITKIPASVCMERKFHVQFWSMMYPALKFTSNTIKSSRNRIQILMKRKQASKQAGKQASKQASIFYLLTLSGYMGSYTADVGSYTAEGKSMDQNQT